MRGHKNGQSVNAYKVCYITHLIQLWHHITSCYSKMVIVVHSYCAGRRKETTIITVLEFSLYLINGRMAADSHFLLSITNRFIKGEKIGCKHNIKRHIN